IREQLLEQARKVDVGVPPAKPGVREAMSVPAANEEDTVTRFAKEYSELALPFGWVKSPLAWWHNDPGSKSISLFGWLLTAFAVSFGAPFWFDLLNKTLGLNARLTVAKSKS